MGRGRPRLRPLSLLPFLVPAAACGWGAGEWTEDDYRAIYTNTLEAWLETAGTDTFVVDPGPTFLIRDEDGAFRMGARNRFGDPALDGAISDVPGVEPCRIDGPGEGCSVENARFAALSEVLPVGAREAALLAAHVDLGTGAVRHHLVRLRRGHGGWRVTSMEESDEARPRR